MDPVGTITWIVLFVIATVTVTGVVGPARLVGPGRARARRRGRVRSSPAVPQVEVQPELILYGILPPLLFAAALRTSIVDVRARNDSILLLSVGLVAFTVVTVGFAACALVPPITLAAAFAFAAVVAPTDAIAVTAIAGRLGLPRRVVTILEGESLLNDATALVALNASIAAIVSVVTPGRDRAGLRRRGRRRSRRSGFVVGFLVSLRALARCAPRCSTRASDADHAVRGVPDRASCCTAPGVLAVVVIAGLYLGFRAPVGLLRRGPRRGAPELAHHPVPARERGLPVHRPEPQRHPRGGDPHRARRLGDRAASASACCSRSWPRGSPGCWARTAAVPARPPADARARLGVGQRRRRRLGGRARRRDAGRRLPAAGGDARRASTCSSSRSSSSSRACSAGSRCPWIIRRLKLPEAEPRCRSSPSGGC